MSIDVDVQLALEGDNQNSNEIPDTADLARWARFVIARERETGEATVRIVGEQESAHLNETYRHKQGPTNVLSFPFEAPPGVPVSLIGDLVICAPVVEREAHEQGKQIKAHWAHMVVHGGLHLLGYDHQTDQEAAEMESLEVRLLGELGFNNPYIETEGA